MFIDPVQTLAAVNLQTTDSVADFGAGSGFIVRALAKLVPQGNIFAIEINRDMVTRLTKELTDAHIANVHVLWGDVEVKGGSNIAQASLDFVVVSNILFQLEDKVGCVEEVARVLKSGGRVLVIDWSESFGGMGPAPHHVFTKTLAEDLFEHRGFKKRSDALPSGEHHYAILFQKDS